MIFITAAIISTAKAFLIISEDDFITSFTPIKLPAMAPIPSGIAASGITKPTDPLYKLFPEACSVYANAELIIVTAVIIDEVPTAIFALRRNK